MQLIIINNNNNARVWAIYKLRTIKRIIGLAVISILSYYTVFKFLSNV